jgi:hypothetical protein
MKGWVMERSLSGLFKTFRAEFVELIREEVKLAKVEMSEKFACFTRNAVALIIGGFVAYAGLIVLVIGLGYFLSLAFEKMGLSRPLAFGAGIAIMGFFIVLVGVAMILKAKITLSKSSLTPEKTINSLREISGADRLDFDQERERKTELKKLEEEAERSSDELEAEIATTHSRMKHTAEMLNRKLNPRYLKQNVQTKICEHPRGSVLAAAGTGFVSALLLAHRRRRARA